MGKSVVTAKLNKSTILSRISQVSIFSTYINISEDIINDCINNNKLIKSPFREDWYPSCGFKYDNKGKLKCRDFGGAFWGDCFDLVALVMSKMYNKEYKVNDKHDFISILNHIRYTFAKEFYSKEVNPEHINRLKNAIGNIKYSKQIIEIVAREWNKNDIYYWNKFGINIHYLNTHFVYPVEIYYINKTINPLPKYYYENYDPCYAYYLGKDRLGIDSMKLYFPNRDYENVRFITNCNHLEGIYDLEKNNYKIIIITKSSKDRLSLGCTLKRLGYDDIGVINIPSETYRLKENEYNWLNSKLQDKGCLVSLMDNDMPGMKEAIWLRNNYNITPLIIDKYKYNSKDFAELYQNNDFPIVEEIIKETFEYIIYYILDEYEEPKNNSQLSWDMEDGNTLPY